MTGGGGASGGDSHGCQSRSATAPRTAATAQGSTTDHLETDSGRDGEATAVPTLESACEIPFKANARSVVD